MQHIRQIEENLFFVGGIDRRLSRFENLFPLPEGVTYNSYVIRDQKNCLLDGVDKAIAEQFIENVEAALEGGKLDYMIVNHVEPDHCQTIRMILDLYPETVLITSQKALQFLEQFYPYDFTSRAQIVKEGDVIDLGQHKLEMIAAAHVHWPEVTMVYEQSQNWLFSADAFGSFKAFEGTIFADEVHWERDWLDEYRRYYTNIVGRFGLQVNKLIEKLSAREIQLILPLHGLIFRKSPEMELAIQKYLAWSNYLPEEAGVVIVYGSLYDNSMQTADRLAAELAQRGVRQIKVYDVAETDYSEIIAQCFRLSNAVFVCNNYNTELYPKMDAFLRELLMLNWDKHKVSLIGNGSWGGRGIPIAQEILSRAKALEEVGEIVQVKGALNEESLEALQKLADEIASCLDA